MNESRSGGPPAGWRWPGAAVASGPAARWRRAGTVAAAVAVAVLLAAGCGRSATARPAGPNTRQQMVAYAQCMRTHGVPTFPDPSTDFGGILFFPQQPSGGPLYQAAKQACHKLQPQGGLGGITAAQR
jgi:hypothetical protein